MVVFRPSLLGSGLDAARAVWQQIASDAFNESVQKSSLFARLAIGGVDSIGEVGDAVEGCLEGKPGEIQMVSQGGLLHEGAHHVVSDLMHEHLLENHLRALASQHIHAQEGLDFPEV